MKNSPCLIKTIITSNFVIAGVSIVLLSLSNALDQSSSTETVLPGARYYRTVKAQLPKEQRQLDDKISELERKNDEISDLERKNKVLAQKLSNSKEPQPKNSISSPLSSASAPSAISLHTLQSSTLSLIQPNNPHLLPQTVVAVSNAPVEARKNRKSPIINSKTALSEANFSYYPAQIQKVNPAGLQYASHIVTGLVVAQNQGQIRHNTKEYSRYQDAIILLRQGYSLEQAATSANVPLSDLYQVIAWGENRPGNPEKHQPPLLAQSDLQLGDLDGPLRYANDIAAGLLVAHRNGQIRYGTIQYRRVQTAINLLRQKKTLDEAAYHAKVNVSTLEQLIKWGANRPGSPIELKYQISRLDPLDVSEPEMNQ